MNNNSMFIGHKPLMEYVRALVTHFTTKGASAMSIHARGKLISRAVDVAQISCTRFLTNVEIKNVKIDSEDFQDEEGKQVRVSNIEIMLEKK